MKKQTRKEKKGEKKVKVQWKEYLCFLWSFGGGGGGGKRVLGQNKSQLLP